MKEWKDLMEAPKDGSKVLLAIKFPALLSVGESVEYDVAFWDNFEWQTNIFEVANGEILGWQEIPEFTK